MIQGRIQDATRYAFMGMLGVFLLISSNAWAADDAALAGLLDNPQALLGELDSRHNAFDDQMGTEWATDGDGDAAALTIDFGRERQLIRFEFRSRAMGDGSAIITSIRLVIDAGRLILGPFETPDPDVEYSFDFEAPVTARTVRVEAVTSTGGNTGAREIRFYSLDD